MPRKPVSVDEACIVPKMSMTAMYFSEGSSTPPMLLYRNLLYTAVTRAQTMVILVGRLDVLRTMVKNHHQALRYTGLYERLLAEKGAGK